MARRFVYRKKNQNRFSMFLAILVLVVLFVAGGIRGIFLNGKLKELDAKKTELQTQIEKEKQREKDIEEYGKYTQTDEYVEEMAREKLGLVREDEIIFHNESK